MDEIGTGKAFTNLIHQALRVYQQDAALAALPRLGDLRVVRSLLRCQPADGVPVAIRAMLDAGLDSLAQVDAKAADLLARRFVREQTAFQVARAYHLSERTFYVRQKAALTALAQIVWQEEERRWEALDEAQQRVLDGLPPPSFSRLFGIQELLARLKSFLATPGHHWLVAVDGMGGIGKTALARAATEELVREGRFQRVPWITAQQHRFIWGHLSEPSQPALTCAAFLEELARALGLDARMDLAEQDQVRRLRDALAGQPTLIVVDNLETAADIRALTEGLDQLARPAKVLLTTRQRVAAYDQVTSLTLRELQPADALAFLRYHSRERNVPALVDAAEADLLRIIAVTDGNPLAIKLVVGQVQALPLAQVLDDLTAARPATHDFYHFLFRYAWERLSEPARHLLLHVPLLDARGAAWEELAAVSGVALDGRFRPALAELVDASLLNAGWVRGRMRYSIHRLTEYYILSDLVGLHRGSVADRPQPQEKPSELPA